MGKNKLQNIKAIEKMLDGTHKFQTKKTVGFSDVESSKKTLMLMAIFTLSNNSTGLEPENQKTQKY
jgi:hypothetical protein